MSQSTIMVRATVIAGRDTLLARSFISRIGTQPLIVDDANKGWAAIERAIASQPELVVIDAARTDIDWVYATHHIRRCLPETAVAVIGTDYDDRSLQDAADAGASCYIVTTGRPTELVQTISKAANGNAKFPPVVNIQIEEPVASPGPSERPDGDGQSRDPHVLPLTARQVEVMQLLARGKRNGEIAEMLFISERTVESHVRAILRKLRAHDRSQALLAAVRAGIVRV